MNAAVRKFLKAFGAVVFLLLFLAGGWSLTQRYGDPMTVIEQSSGKVTVESDQPVFPDTAQSYEREFRHLTLKTEKIGRIEAFVSQPRSIPGKGLPVIVIMGGLEIKIEDFGLIGDPGNNIYVIFKYPYSPEYWYRGAPLEELPRIREAVYRVPSQALTLHDWVVRQPWAQQGRTTFAGFSFGAIFMPSIFHLAQSRDVELNPGIIAYAGADLYDLFYTNLDRFEKPLRILTSWTLETLIRAVEPALHLPCLHNEFLLINGTKDHQISTYSWQRLHALTPEPKTIVILEEGHMHPRKPELTKKLVGIGKEWLKNKDLIN